MTDRFTPAPGALVYSYTRFSAMKQAEGNSVDRQADYAAQWAAEHGLILDTALTMKDEGLSAYHQAHVKKGALGVFLRAVDEGRVPTGSVLIVESLDRLSRATPLEAQAQLTLIVNAGIIVVTAKDKREYSRELLQREPMQLLMSLILMIRAHEESATKSDRVTKAFLKQLRGWGDGTYRGRVRTGKDPLWVKWVGGEQRWALVPERLKYVLRVIELYRSGMGCNRIATCLEQEGHKVQNGYLFRVVKSRALLGEMQMTLGGETFTLENYYPAVITQADWDDIRAVSAGRDRTSPRARSDVPGILNGCGALKCAYCGLALGVYNMLQKPRAADGRMRDGCRRLRCLGSQANHAYKDRCPSGGKGTSSAAPFERAIMKYCSDMMNLQSLYTGDRTAAPKALLAASRSALVDLEVRQANLLEVIMEMGKKAPAAYVAKSRALEEERAGHEAAIAQAERELAAAARVSLVGLDDRWRNLAAGVEAQEYEARMQARKLVGDTFERITIYWQKDANGYCGMVLRGRGGATRRILVDKQGNYIDADEMETPPMPLRERA